MKTQQSIFDKLTKENNINAEIRLSISGDYYQLYIDGEPIIADSACEDLYDKESAIAMFNDYIKEYYL